MKSKIHFICIDARKRDSEGNLYVILQKGETIFIPPDITRVPALIILTQNNRIVFGAEEIQRIFAEISGDVRREIERPATHAGLAAAAAAEPSPYILNSAVGCGASGFGVTSDQYSYYDMSPDDLRCDSVSGKRQMHNYVKLEEPSFKIPTPEETYRPDKIGDITLEKLQQQRNSEVPQPPQMQI